MYSIFWLDKTIWMFFKFFMPSILDLRCPMGMESGPLVVGTWSLNHWPAKNVINTIQIDPCNNVHQHIRIFKKSHNFVYFSFIMCSQEPLAAGKFRILAAQYKSGNFGSSTLNVFNLSSPKIHTINELYKSLHWTHCLLNQSVGFRLSNYFYLFIYIF